MGEDKVKAGSGLEWCWTAYSKRGVYDYLVGVL